MIQSINFENHKKAVGNQVPFWLTLKSIEPEKEKHEVEIVSKSRMRAIFVGLGVFGILAAIGLGIAALVIG